MKWDSLALAIFPPLLAIVAEWLNWMSLHHLSDASRQIVKNEGLPKTHEDQATDVVTYTSKGVASISNIQSTFISVLTAAAVTSHDAANGYWPLLAAIVLMTAFAMFLIYIKAHKNYFDIGQAESGTLFPRLPKWLAKQTFDELLSFATYAINGLLVLFCIVVYAASYAMGSK